MGFLGQSKYIWHVLGSVMGAFGTCIIRLFNIWLDHPFWCFILKIRLVIHTITKRINKYFKLEQRILISVLIASICKYFRMTLYIGLIWYIHVFDLLYD